MDESRGWCGDMELCAAIYWPRYVSVTNSSYNYKLFTFLSIEDLIYVECLLVYEICIISYKIICMSQWKSALREWAMGYFASGTKRL